MTERNGVRIGQRASDLDGADLGRVTAVHEWGFHVSRGVLLFRRDYVVRYDEIRGVRDGDLVVARSARDLLDLAAGGLPASWRIPVPPAFPSAATPSEAQSLRADIAAGAISSDAAAAAEPPRHATPPSQPPAPLEPGDERRSYEARGQAVGAAPPVEP